MAKTFQTGESIIALSVFVKRIIGIYAYQPLKYTKRLLYNRNQFFSRLKNVPKHKSKVKRNLS